MGKSAEKKGEEPIQLDQNGILGRKMTEWLEAEPREEHLKAAMEATALDDEAKLPQLATIADLITYVQTVRAARGNQDAWRDFLDRFQPKPSRPTTAVIMPTGTISHAGASQNSEEQAEGDSYYDELSKTAGE